MILTLVSPCRKSASADKGGPQRGHICELRQLDRSQRHAQVRTYLTGERGARAASKDVDIPHGESGCEKYGGKKEIVRKDGPGQNEAKDLEAEQ